MLIYAFLGSSKHLVVGPVAVAALLVASAIAEHAPNYNDAYLTISSVLCLQVGLMLFALRIFNMGGLVNLLSHPVITGFVNAAAIDHHFPAAGNHRHQHRSGRQLRLFN